MKNIAYAVSMDKISNNRNFDSSTGRLGEHYRFEVSGILVVSVDEALNAYATENNSDETGALKPLEDRLAYFKMGGCFLDYYGDTGLLREVYC